MRKRRGGPKPDAHYVRLWARIARRVGKWESGAPHCGQRVPVKPNLTRTGWRRRDTRGR